MLKSPKLDGDKLTFEVSVLEGGLSKATGPASLFIDWFAARGCGGRAVVGGVGYHGGAWHGAWYAHPAGVAAGAAVGAAALGAAAAGAYYHPYACTAPPGHVCQFAVQTGGSQKAFALPSGERKEVSRHHASR